MIQQVKTQRRNSADGNTWWVDEAVQVIAPDGKPAVRITITRYERVLMRDGAPAHKFTLSPTGEPIYTDEPAIRQEVVRRELMRFPTPYPVKAMGRFVVGQYSGMKLHYQKVTGKEALNPDADTYMSFFAWEAAFEEVYSES